VRVWARNQIDSVPLTNAQVLGLIKLIKGKDGLEMVHCHFWRKHQQNVNFSSCL